MTPHLSRHHWFLFWSWMPWPVGIWLSGKELACQCKKCGFVPWVGKIPWRREWQSTPVFLPGKPMNRGVWWATVHGVSKSRAWHKDWVRTHTMTGPSMAVLPHYQSYLFKALDKGRIWAHLNEAWDWMKRQQGASVYLPVLFNDCCTVKENKDKQRGNWSLLVHNNKDLKKWPFILYSRAWELIIYLINTIMFWGHFKYSCL